MRLRRVLFTLLILIWTFALWRNLPRQEVAAAPQWEEPRWSGTMRLVMLEHPGNTKTVAAVWPKKAPRTRLGTDCVSTLKRAGLLPQGRVTLNGRASSIPVKPLKLSEGEKAVVKTREGPIGHVVYVEKVDGQYVSRVEGGYRGGIGRVVNPKMIVGEVTLP